MSQPPLNSAILHGGGVTRAQARYGGAWEDWLDLSTGLNPVSVTLPQIDLATWQRLPDERDMEAAAQAACKFYHAPAGSTLPVPGLQSVIQLLPRLMDTSRRVAILGPTYGEYARVFTQEGFAVDLIDELGEITSAHGAAILVNPNNPTGRIVSRDALSVLLTKLQAQGTWLIVDEAFCDPTPEHSLAQFAGEPHLLVLRSFGKFFGLAGARLGFVLGDEMTLNKITSWLGPWAVSGPALRIAAEILSHDPASIIHRLRARRAALQLCLENARLRVIGGTDFFALVEHQQAFSLYEHLARRQILTRVFDYSSHWMRIGLAANESQDARLLAALQSFGRES
jgi:cobalamin biosynthetic protein CobC